MPLLLQSWKDLLCSNTSTRDWQFASFNVASWRGAGRSIKSSWKLGKSSNLRCSSPRVYICLFLAEHVPGDLWVCEAVQASILGSLKFQSCGIHFVIVCLWSMWMWVDSFDTCTINQFKFMLHLSWNDIDWSNFWPRHCPPQLVTVIVICPGRPVVLAGHLSWQVICPICCAMSLQTIDLLSKGDTQKGWEKVTTTSVMDVLKWRTGDYRVLVTDAEPMPVPGLIHVTNVEFCFYPVPVTF